VFRSHQRIKRMKRMEVEQILPNLLNPLTISRSLEEQLRGHAARNT